MKNSNPERNAARRASAWFLAAGVATSMLSMPHGAVAQSTEADKPNVVLMLSDNIGYGDIGAFQGGAIRGAPTPMIDQLASEGLTLTQFLVEPGCTPSRAGLITGRY